MGNSRLLKHLHLLSPYVVVHPYMTLSNPTGPPTGIPLAPAVRAPRVLMSGADIPRQGKAGAQHAWTSPTTPSPCTPALTVLPPGCPCGTPRHSKWRPCAPPLRPYLHHITPTPPPPPQHAPHAPTSVPPQVQQMEQLRAPASPGGRSLFRFKTGDAASPHGGPMAASPYAVSPVGLGLGAGGPLGEDGGLAAYGNSPRRAQRKIARAPFKVRSAATRMLCWGRRESYRDEPGHAGWLQADCAAVGLALGQGLRCSGVL